MKTAKLSAEIKKSENIQTAFFWGLWFINAFATAVFGAEYLPSLFSQLVGWLPAGDWISAILAVVASLVVFDVAFKCWDEVGKTAETSTQHNAAAVGEWSSFAGSLVYTAITFATYVFPDIITTSTASFLSGAGGLIFITQVVVHLVLMKIWVANGVEAREHKMRTKATAATQSEKLAFQDNVLTKALLIAKGKTDDQAESLAETLGHLWASSMVADAQNYQPDKRKDAPQVLIEANAPLDPPEAPPSAQPQAAQPVPQWEEIPVTQAVERVRPEPSLNGHGHPRPNSHPSPFGD
ncbi:MAG: hypothetical protein OT477_14745 [Chloroflexi bacterium]|nr:hypothetical protein [Chloroflexota bacterium]